MKFCPYCGAALPGGAAPFCPECGKKLTDCPHKGEEGKRRPPRRNAKKKVLSRDDSGPDQQDEKYDGYYEDVAPVDVDRASDRVDPALIKRVLLVVLGTVGVIVLAAVIMMLL